MAYMTEMDVWLTNMLNTPRPPYNEVVNHTTGTPKRFIRLSRNEVLELL